MISTAQVILPFRCIRSLDSSIDHGENKHLIIDVFGLRLSDLLLENGEYGVLHYTYPSLVSSLRWRM